MLTACRPVRSLPNFSTCATSGFPSASSSALVLWKERCMVARISGSAEIMGACSGSPSPSSKYDSTVSIT